jgi:hypothetical protein
MVFREDAWGQQDKLLLLSATLLLGDL